MKKFEILGVKIDAIDFGEILDLVSASIAQKKKAQIATVNNEFIIEAVKNEEFREILNNCTLCIPDSVGIVWAVKRSFKITIKRTPGADLFEKICKLAQGEKLRIFLFGGASGVAKSAKLVLQKHYKGIHIVGTLDGIKVDAKKTDPEVISEINNSKPDILFVALGSPKQEFFIANNLSKLNASFFIGIGGTLDYVSGRVKRAPRLVRKLGMEWLFRLVVEPKRILRIISAIIVFPYLVISRQKVINMSK